MLVLFNSHANLTHPAFSLSLLCRAALALLPADSIAGAVIYSLIYLWRQYMKASLFYQIAAVLLLLFAAGHTFGFSQSDPTWGVDALVGSMRSIHFEI